VNVGNGKIVLNGANGNASVNGVAMLNGGAYIGPRVEGGSLPALTVNGVTASKGIHNGGQKITGIADGNVDAASDQAVNGSQLHSEQEARVAGDTNTLNEAKADATAKADEAKREAVAQANGYTDSEIEASKQHANSVGSNSVAQSKAYTDQQISQVRKEVDGVGAMAMAASVSGSVTIEPGKSTAVTAAVGSYGGSKAIAVGVTHIVAPNQRVFATISRATGSKTGVAVGASFSF
jgi:autotransporter adhesin